MPYRFTTIAFDDAPVTGRAVDVFLPPGQPRPVAVFMVHGGGWWQGGRAQYHALMSALRAQCYIAASTDYRLEGVTIQDQLHDVRLGYRLFRQELAALGPPPPVVTFGGSVGGHLAALLTLALAAPGACGEDVEDIAPEWVRPAGAILASAPATFEPWDGIFPGIWESMQEVVGRSWREDPDAYRRVSPTCVLTSRRNSRGRHFFCASSDAF